ncbi:MAG: DUF2807 domain-containing protein, partial [Bacteroidales bacterium]|nr:DUF2807 domain-containing protein [Bacteroidales bacterium]
WNGIPDQYQVLQMKTGRFNILFFIALVLFFNRCAKDEGICVGKTGKSITQDRIAIPFHAVEVYDNINVILTQDTSHTAIQVEAGENLIDGISTEIDSGRLVLRNLNSCNWLRSFEVPVNVYLKFTSLDTLIFQAAGNISCTNAWTNDSVYFNVIEGGGQIDLNLDVFKSFLFVRYGTVTVNVRGNSQVTFISSQGYGPFHAEQLVSKFTYVYTFSPNDVFVHASVALGAEIANIGNVYYRGDPDEVNTVITGEGRLIEF